MSLTEYRPIRLLSSVYTAILLFFLSSSVNLIKLGGWAYALDSPDLVTVIANSALSKHYENGAKELFPGLRNS